MRYCSKCGAMNDTDANFCQGCGAKFSTSSAEEIKTDYTTPLHQEEAPKQEQFVYQCPAPQQNTYNPDIPVSNLLNAEQQAAKSRSVAAMVLGICAIVFSSIPIIGVTCGIIGLVLAVKAGKIYENGMEKAGKITSIIGIVLSVLVFLLTLIIIIAFISSDGSYYYDSPGYYDDYSDFFEYYYDLYGFVF